MSEDAATDDYVDDGRQSKRAIFKDALSRTRSKFKKSENNDVNRTRNEFTLSDDVNDFLAAGRTSTVTRPAANTDPSPAQPLRSPGTGQPQLSPRGVPIPRLDVSQSARWPSARPIESQSFSEEFLRPLENGQRSQSVSSFKKRRSKPRNLSVSFVSRPPDVIGEGGDEAEAPPAEISWSRQRTRSASPMVVRPTSYQSVSSQESPSIRRKPLPQSPQPKLQPENELEFVPKPLRRTQTGFDGSARSVADQDFEHTLKKPTAGSISDPDSLFKTPLFSPTPVRPPVAPGSLQAQSPPSFTPIVASTDVLKIGEVQVMVADREDPSLGQQRYSSQPPSIYRSPNFSGVVSHQQLAHRSRPSSNEVHATSRGTEGWL